MSTEQTIRFRSLNQWKHFRRNKKWILNWMWSGMFDYDAGGPGFDSHPGWDFIGSTHLPSF